MSRVTLRETAVWELMVKGKVSRLCGYCIRVMLRCGGDKRWCLGLTHPQAMRVLWDAPPSS